VAGEHRDLPVRHAHVPDLDGAVHAAGRDDAVVVLAPVHAQDLRAFGAQSVIILSTAHGHDTQHLKHAIFCNLAEHNPPSRPLHIPAAALQATDGLWGFWPGSSRAVPTSCWCAGMVRVARGCRASHTFAVLSPLQDTKMSACAGFLRTAQRS